MKILMPMTAFDGKKVFVAFSALVIETALNAAKRQARQNCRQYMSYSMFEELLTQAEEMIKPKEPAE